jgi:signal recognition particle subunit SRP54
MGQLAQIRRLGDMKAIMEKIPGMSQVTRQFGMGGDEMEQQMGQLQAIYSSMTQKERGNIALLDGSRRRRIARGAGVEVHAVGQFIKQFETMRDTMKAVGGMGLKGRLSMMRHLASGNLAGLGMPGGPTIKVKKSGFMEKKDRNKKKKRR